MTRIYQPISLAVNTSIQLNENASHHVARVLRAAVGEELTLFNGQGGEYAAVISQITKKNVEVRINSFSEREAESSIQIHLAQGIARGEKMDFIVQKAVELGVNKIIPLMTERCNVKLDQQREEKRLQHWQAIAVSAAEQSGRNRITEITAPIHFQAWLQQVKAEFQEKKYGFVLSPYADVKIDQIYSNKSKLPESSVIQLLIGPEGGFSDAEIHQAIQHEFIPLNLGPRILRTETASLAAISVLQLRFGDF